MNRYPDNGLFSCGVFVGFQKTNATADHEILWKNYGFIA